MPKQNIHGVLLLDKPSGLTSNAALMRAKRLFNAAKAGHTGTLDPMASGLLPLCFGEATKFSADLLNADKQYHATLLLGITTTTGDADGETVETRPVTVTRPEIESILTRFRGEIEQIPPMYSALKRDGKPLYAYARAGQTVERAARRIRIDRLELREFDGLRLSIEVDCSKGTYIRTLAEDIGWALGCGAHLIALRRTRVGSLSLDAAVTLEHLEASDAVRRSAALLPVDTLLGGLPRVDLNAELAARLRLGQRLPWRDPAAPVKAGLVRVYGPADDGQPILIGLADLRADGVLAPSRLIHPGAA